MIMRPPSNALLDMAARTSSHDMGGSSSTFLRTASSTVAQAPSARLHTGCHHALLCQATMPPERHYGREKGLFVEPTSQQGRRWRQSGRHSRQQIEQKKMEDQQENQEQDQPDKKQKLQDQKDLRHQLEEVI